jgi:hypothetical protein
MSDSERAPAVTIRALAGGYYRLGRHHPMHEVTHPAGTYNTNELDMLLDDPALLVDLAPVGAATAATGEPTQAGPLDESDTATGSVAPPAPAKPRRARK